MNRNKHAAFSLVEILAVISIIGVMMGLLGLSVGQMTAQSARKGAVNMVMNTFEQARVAALRYSTNVYVGFANADDAFNEDQKFRSFIVFRNRLETDNPPASDPSSSEYVYLTDWEKLPKGISFRSDRGTVIAGNEKSKDITLPDGEVAEDVPIMKFNQTGAISAPVPGSGNELSLLIYEGYFDDATGRDVVTINSSSDLFEYFTFARFTGRIRHEITSLQ